MLIKLTESNKIFNIPIFKGIIDLLTCELLFLVVFRILLILFPHREHEFIYYFNINILYINACLIWISASYSDVNKVVVYLIGTWLSFTFLYSVFFIFVDPIDQWYLFSINYHILSIVSTTLQLLISSCIFNISIVPYRFGKYILKMSIFISIMTALMVYTPFLLKTDFYDLTGLFQHDYYIHILNFSLLVVFWHQYTQNKIILSEYLSNILAVFTIIVGIEIFHFFSFKNDLLFHYSSQYFYAFLYCIMGILWLVRLAYLKTPDSKKNEEYIRNYYVLQGIITKPRQGLLVEFYTNINKSVIIISVIVMILLGIFLFFFNKFEIFIRLNLLLLIIAVIISIILSIVTWHRRWYEVIGFLFRGRKSKRK